MKNKSFLNNDINATLNPNMKVYANPFPEKMASAVAFLNENGLPPDWERPKARKKTPRSILQNELLNIYSFDPTEQQLQQLKTFMAQLFADKLQAKRAEITAY